MARRRRRDLSTQPPITSHPRAVVPDPVRVSPLTSRLIQNHIRLELLRRQVLREIEDRRRFSFDVARVPKTYGGLISRQKVPSRRSARLPSNLAFVDPRRVLLCARRKTRAEVLHAMRKTGKGRGRRRSPRRNAYSNISCRG